MDSWVNGAISTKIIRFLHKHILILSILLTFIIYANALPNDFVADDRIQILGNPLSQSIINIPRFFLGSTFFSYGETRGNFYKPIMTTLYAFIYTFFGANPVPFHLLQILLHALNSFLVYKLFKSFFSDNFSLFGMLVFLLHPINTETVIYIANLQDVLFLFFGLTALVVRIKKPNLKRRNLIVYTLLALALLSKETGLLFLPIIFIYEYLYDRASLYKTTLLIFSIFFSYLLLKYVIAGVGWNMDPFSTISRKPLLSRVEHIPVMLTFYLTTFFYPKDLVVLQNWVISDKTLNNFYFPILTIIFTLSLLTYFYLKYCDTQQQKKRFVFFILWLFLGLGIHMQLHALDATVADRWFYFPSVSAIAIVMFFIEKIKNIVKHKHITTLFALLLLILLGGRSFIRTFDWRDETTLAKHDLQVQPNNFVLHTLYGLSRARAGDILGAEKHYLQSTKIDPGNNMAWHNLGSLYEERGFKEKNREYYLKAEYFYRKAIQTGHDPTSYVNLAALLLFRLQADFSQTDAFLDEALRKFPTNPNLILMHAITQYKLGNNFTAINQAEKAIRLEPQNQLFRDAYSLMLNNQDIKLSE